MKFDIKALKDGLSEELLARIRRDTASNQRLRTQTPQSADHEAESAPKEIPIYFFEVDGLVPEFYRGLVAFRRAKHYNTHGMKVIKCPYCRGDFDMVDMEVKVELRCFAINSKAPKLFNVVPCRKCDSMVGVTYERQSA